MRRASLALALVALFATHPPRLEAAPAFHRTPSLHGDTIVFVSEGDLWTISVHGGRAARLTTHAGVESDPALSPDGRTVAFTGRYEGQPEVYTMPLRGGGPTRHTFDGHWRTRAAGWDGEGRLLHVTGVHSTLPSSQLVAIDLETGERSLHELAQADDGTHGDDGTLYFTRWRAQGSKTRRYVGGTAQSIWKLAPGAAEAVPLTADYPGTSRRPTWWRGRIYFLSDRDGTMNVWSMRPDGGGLQPVTSHSQLEVAAYSLHEGRIAYQHGPDIRLRHLDSGVDRLVEIDVPSDVDQMRERWVDEPMDYLTAAHVSPDGQRVVLTARGQVFVAPRKQGRLVEATRRSGVRYRQARFLDDDTLVVLSDEDGEVEVWTLPANGVGEPEQLTDGGDVLRWEAVPSPDGRFIAHDDKNQRLFIFDTRRGRDRLVDESAIDGFTDLAWSPDGRWLAYVAPADNMFRQVKICEAATGETTTVTTDRFDSFSPAWSPDGEWLYLLSDRNLETLVKHPWGSYQPEPFLHRKTKIFQLALREGLRSPFAPATELDPEEDSDDESDEEDEDDTLRVEIELEGIQERLHEVPVEPGRYWDLTVSDEALFWMSRALGADDADLVGAAVTREDVEVETLVEGVDHAELSTDGETLLVRKEDELHLVEASPSSVSDLGEKAVPLGAWALSVIPREEWRQMFREAWRLERDYFYDRTMHGVDWPAMLERYLPYVDRVRTRRELAEVISWMVSELSALHIYVYGGDARTGDDDIAPASLGATLERDEEAGGYRVTHVPAFDPDEPQLAGPLTRHGVDVREGAIIEAINGTPLLSVAHPGVLLRQKAGHQVLLTVRDPRSRASRDVIVKPITPGQAADRRYHEWEHGRRLAVEEMGGGDIGYVHLRAMGASSWTEWAKGFYPVFDRAGLIVDVRHNGGGNIDSWILEKLMRKAWFYWNQRVGRAPIWNMQYAFRGHLVVLCNERTGSDGEAFTEGVRRLGLGTIIGTRTWGGEIWLTSSNVLVDKGIATSAEFGVFGPEGEWLIEGHGVEPDIVVDNLPHETFHGRDAQLEAAVELLQRKIAAEPVEPPPVPPFPDKSFVYPR